MRNFQYVIALLIGLSLPAYAKEISNYNDFIHYIQQGKNFKLVTKFIQCHSINNEPINVISYVIPSEIIIVPNQQHISMSSLHFTNHMDSPTYEYVRYTFSVENSAAIQIFKLNPQTFQPTAPVKEFECPLNKGIFVYTTK